MAELRKEYEAVIGNIETAWSGNYLTSREVVRAAVTACQELADRPRRELTNAEIDCLWPVNWYRPEGDYTAPRRLLDAHIAKQREPATVRLRVATSKTTGEVYAFTPDKVLHSDWEWLDADGKPQEFEVRI